MYKCYNKRCGEVFSEPYARREDAGEFAVCPVCGCDIYEEVLECEVCGEWVSVDDMYYTKKDNIKHYICGECADGLSEEEQNDLRWYI